MHQLSKTEIFISNQNLKNYILCKNDYRPKSLIDVFIIYIIINIIYDILSCEVQE